MASGNIAPFLAALAKARRPVPLEERLATLFDQIGPLTEIEQATRARASTDILNLARLRDVLDDLSTPLAFARSVAPPLNPWIVAGLKRDEVRNAAVLAALWDPRRTGPAAIDFLVAFAKRVRLASPLPVEAIRKGSYQIRVEDSPLGLETERVDLTIEGNGFLIAVEIKIRASLGKTQLARYVDTVKRRADMSGSTAHVVLLAPYDPDHPEVAAASWKDVFAAARAAAPRRVERSQARFLIEQFADHIASWSNGA